MNEHLNLERNINEELSHCEGLRKTITKGGLIVKVEICHGIIKEQSFKPSAGEFVFTFHDYEGEASVFRVNTKDYNFYYDNTNEFFVFIYQKKEH